MTVELNWIERDHAWSYYCIHEGYFLEVRQMDVTDDNSPWKACVAWRESEKSLTYEWEWRKEDYRSDIGAKTAARRAMLRHMGEQ